MSNSANTDKITFTVQQKPVITKFAVNQNEKISFKINSQIKDGDATILEHNANESAHPYIQNLITTETERAKAAEEELRQVTGKIKYDTKSNWDASKTLIGEEGTIYIYSDYYSTTTTAEDGTSTTTYTPAVKIGDGKAYLIDTPVINGLSPEQITTLLSHVENADIHVTADDKTNWNSAVKCEVNGENLVFTNVKEN